MNDSPRRHRDTERRLAEFASAWPGREKWVAFPRQKRIQPTAIGEEALKALSSKSRIGKTSMIEAELTKHIIGAAIEVHKHWGPGLYEEIYEKSLYHELRLRNMAFVGQLRLPLIYKGKKVGDDLRLDLIVESKVVLELKAVKELEPIHEAQLLTYMKLTNCRVGLLINFNVPVLKHGIKRMVL